MAFVKDIERNGVLYSGIWPKQSIKSKKKGISITSLYIIAPCEHFTVYGIESNRIEIYID